MPDRNILLAGSLLRASDLRGNLAERRHLFYGCEAHELEVLEGAVRLNDTGDCRPHRRIGNIENGEDARPIAYRAVEANELAAISKTIPGKPFASMLRPCDSANKIARASFARCHPST
jgi:hypothetical protein